nr:hypothetical protein [Tanacetum cinerariifolium]
MAGVQRGDEFMWWLGFDSGGKVWRLKGPAVVGMLVDDESFYDMRELWWCFGVDAAMDLKKNMLSVKCCW